ncbi:hypothetical protein ACIP3A_06330 [Streptomyces tricolor]|uniref:hypothetical protein n=1 Tax=Streptomyces tricolor TaxID=68277 RepID=UPI00380A1CFD
MSDYLFAAAQWRGQHRGAAKGSPPKLLMEAASRSLSVAALADEADLATLRAAYDPAPPPGRPARASTGLPPAPPHAPPAGPAPGR